MQVACVLYDEFTMLDIVGPFQVFSSVPDMEIVWVADEPGPVSDHTRTGSIVASTAFDDITSPDIVIVPGGMHTTDHLDGPIIPWIQTVHPTTTWTTSVCTGSLLLAGAGLLQGMDATCHWASMDKLAGLGAKPTGQRVVIDEEAHIVTAAGVSAGIDMGLALLAKMRGIESAQAVQLAIEYDPQPITDAGSPDKAPPEIVEMLRPFLGT